MVITKLPYGAKIRFEDQPVWNQMFSIGHIFAIELY